MKVTSKGQITIPQGVREQAGVFPGTEVTVAFADGKIIVSKTNGRSRGEEIVARLRGKATAGFNTDEIMALTRGED